MKVTTEVIRRLENLHMCMCLETKRKYGSDGPFIVENGLYCVTGYKTELYKPLFGKPYTKLTEIYVKLPNEMGTTWHSVYSTMLEYILNCVERDRENYLKVKNEFAKFGFTITKNN